MQTYADRLTEIYHFRRESEVRSFLERNDFLAPLLIEARQQIKERFGEETPVALEVFHDPEGEGESELFALIRTELPVEEARRRRARFDEEWWRSNSSRACCRLNIDLEYQE